MAKHESYSIYKKLWLSIRTFFNTIIRTFFRYVNFPVFDVKVLVIL